MPQIPSPTIVARRIPVLARIRTACMWVAQPVRARRGTYLTYAGSSIAYAVIAAVAILANW